MEDNKLQEEEEKNESSDSGDLVKNYKSIIDQQQQQIDRLLKQQEINKKINDQLNETLEQKLKESKEKNTNPYQWIDDAINKNFEYKATFDINNNQDAYKGSEQIGAWYMRYLKEQGYSEKEIYSKMDRVFEVLNTGLQPHENI